MTDEKSATRHNYVQRCVVPTQVLGFRVLGPEISTGFKVQDLLPFATLLTSTVSPFVGV